MLDYLEKPKKKKKKSDKEKEQPAVKPKPVRNFKIIDDDINLNELKPSEETEALVDLLDPEGPSIAGTFLTSDFDEKPKTAEKTELFTTNKWIKLNVVEDEQGEINVTIKQSDVSAHKSLFRKRHDKPAKVNEDGDSDLDLPRKRPTAKDYDNDSDLDSLPRRRDTTQGDLSPVRKGFIKKEEEEVDETKTRVRRLTKAEQEKKIKAKEKLEKYMEWGKGLVQKKEKEDKLKFDLHEAEKPLARYKNDQDLDGLLKDVEREEDPMLEYIRKNKPSQAPDDKPRYKGPPAPPNRYNIMPGARWDGVDRSNGYEKKYYESIAAKKSRDEEAYKWSVEDM